MTGVGVVKQLQARVRARIRAMALVSAGVLAGVGLSLGISAWASREALPEPLPIEDIRRLADVFGAVKANYVEPVEDRRLIKEAISGMLSGLDPHSAYLDAEAFKDLQTSTQGEFGGLGIEVGYENGAVRVIAPIDDTPAARAGIVAGDLIIKIDEQLTRGLTLMEAVKIMRGKPGTSIVLTVVRQGAADPLRIELVREQIKVQSVKSRMVEPGYAFVRISQFQERTTEDLARHLQALSREPSLKGLVLDLRNDPGGLLHAAVGVSAAFLPSNALVVSTDGRNPDSHRRFLASPQDYARDGDDPLLRLPEVFKTVPMVVLVNGASASASEIVAGALQDSQRAVVMGTQTFGKGSVQSIIQIRSDSDQPAAIKLTTARYYTPSGRSIQATGIVPDLLVDDTAEGSFSGLSVREADLARHLENDLPIRGASPGPDQFSPPAVQPSTSSERRYEWGSAQDFQLAQALHHLKGEPVTLAKVATPVDKPEAAATP
ncbi:MAG TPA: S41 family peptidase [Burkholderiaceae bacterium]|nr:S41 family peptidase [Burkholderiaceae bacterium]